MMERVVGVLILSLAILQAVSAKDNRCEGKNYFDVCDENKWCICPSLLIAVDLTNNPLKACDKGQMVCRFWPCWNYFDFGVPQRPRKGPKGEFITCSSDDQCTKGSDRCTPDGYCCTDTPIWPPK
ncbi:uncharacterized protein LOC128554249 [Mercenaria mercenaria]|uniref:uncharacterized protein LOC128554249 n=1 Tax=Mercenaria mercenaria TaxID=6596 RepID=UPI00234EEA62|nr:uncharacterized protein LOC128554249 [Mercenaria mercenaria]